jgi:hypothetical protein
MGKMEYFGIATKEDEDTSGGRCALEALLAPETIHETVEFFIKLWEICHDEVKNALIGLET